MRPRRLLVLLVIASALAQVAFSQQPAGVATLNSPDFLKAPEGLADIAVAKVAPTVDVHIFKDLPAEEKGTLWSDWGDGCLASNGKYYASIGNHLELYGGVGQSRVYEYDPAAKAVRLVINVREVLPDLKLAGGKIHARIDEAKDGWLYFTTYWGKIPKDADWQAGFQGSVLLRYNPATGKAENLGVPVPQQGLPTSCMDPERTLLYFYAVYSGDLVVYDLAERKVKYRGSGDIQEGGRNIILDADGNAYFSAQDAYLWRYSPATNKVDKTKAQLPESPGAGDRGGRSLRASTRPAKDGTVYGMTQTGIMFAFDPKKETITNLGPNLGQGYYTAVMVLSPDDRYVYYAPGAHGSATRAGTPIVQYSIATKTRKAIVFLSDVLRKQFNYNIAGTYAMKITPDGSTLFGTFNGAPYDPNAKREETFGQPSLVAIHIPREERE